MKSLFVKLSIILVVASMTVGCASTFSQTDKAGMKSSLNGQNNYIAPSSYANGFDQNGNMVLVSW